MTTALLLTSLAGAATVLGGVVAVHHRVRSDAGLAMALGFAAGAMVLVSVAEILPKGAAGLEPAVGGASVAWVSTVALAALGAGAVVVLVRLLVDRRRSRDGAVLPLRRTVLRTGVVVAVVVTAHNVPEGLATFLATLQDPRAGAGVALAIAIHNVPEGVAVAAPLYGAGSSRVRAVGAAAASGLAEPVGAVLGYLVLAAVLPASAFGVVFGLLAGVMLSLSATELLPSARRLGSPRLAGVSVLTGGTVMAVSLVLLRLV